MCRPRTLGSRLWASWLALVATLAAGPSGASSVAHADAWAPAVLAAGDATARVEASEPASLPMVAEAAQARKQGLGHMNNTLSRTKASALAALLGCVLVLAVAPILVREGPVPFAAVLLYLSSLVVVQPLVKQTFQHGHPYPYSITMLHMVLTALVASVLDRPRVEDAVQVLPVAVISGLSLSFANSALVFGTTAFVTMVGAYTPATTLLLMSASRCGWSRNCSGTHLVDGSPILACRSWWRSVSGSTTGAVLLVCCGAALCIRSEAAFSALALGLATLANLCRSLRTIWQHELLRADLPPCRAVAWTGVWSALLMVPVVAKYEGLEPLYSVRHGTLASKLALLGSCAAAVVLNISQCLVIKYLGPVEQTLIGNLQILGVLFLATLWLGESVLAAQWVGIFLILIGCTITRPLIKDKLLEQDERRRLTSGNSTAGPEPSMPKDTEQGPK